MHLIINLIKGIHGRRNEAVVPLQMRLINVNKLNIFRRQITDFTRPDEPTDDRLSQFIGQLLPFCRKVFIGHLTSHTFEHFFVGLFVSGWEINPGSWLRARFTNFPDPGLFINLQFKYKYVLE